MRVCALYRVSTEKQMNEGCSLEAQERQYKQLAKSNGWITIAEFRGCESATQAATERQVLQQVLACIREQRPDAVYVHEQSRLSRGDELDVYALFRELRERSIKIIVGGVIRDLASIDERFMLGIQSLVDRAESERIKERMRRGKRERALQGKKNCGLAPYGYINPPAGDPNRGKLQVVQEEAEIVRRVFQLAADGKADRLIARLLTQESIASPRGGAWGKTTVCRLLRNPAYIGMHASHAWIAENGTRTFRFDLQNPDAIVVEDAHEPIVSRELWDAAQSRPKAPRTSRPNMLTGRLWVNGAYYSGDTCRSKSFYCDRQRRSGKPWLPVVETDALIWRAFTSLAASPKYVAAMIHAAQNRRSSGQIVADVERKKAEIAKLSKRLDRLVDIFADGDLSRAIYQRKVAETSTALTNAETSLQALRVEIAQSDGTLAERVVKAVQALTGRESKLSMQQKATALRSIVTRIDAVAEPVKCWQPRNDVGHFQQPTSSKWKLKNLEFQLAIQGDNRVGNLVTTS